MKSFNIYLGKKCIDTVFYNDKCEGGADITPEVVKESLVNHDGYNQNIVVVKVK